MFQATPAIYSGPSPAQPLSAAARAAALLISGACLAVLLVAARLNPDPAGESTHTQLGMNRCQFLAQTGLPCPSCGMTTSFAWRSEEHTSELQSHSDLVCRLLLEK